jgi:hypothetical protein
MLEEAIATVEAEYAGAAASVEPEENEFDRIFAEYDDADTARPAAGSGDANPQSPAGPAKAAPDSRAREGHFTAPAEPPHAPVPPIADQTADIQGDAPPPVVGPEHEDDVVPESARAGAYAEGSPLGRSTAARKPRRRSLAGLVVTLFVLVVLAGAAYGVWLNRAEFADLFDMVSERLAGGGEAAPEDGANRAEAEAAASDRAGEPADGQQAASRQPEGGAAATTEEADGQAAPHQKFTQRLMPDGTEIDEGPVAGEPALGEGTSVSEATTPPAGTAPAGGEEQTADRQTVPVGQRAYFYEEQTNSAQGSAETGSVVWSLVEESPGNDLPAEPAVRAEANIPGKDVQLKMTIRRNADPSLPASHIIEMIFLTPDDFDGGGIDSVLRIAMKPSEQETGSPLLGVPAKIADGFFLVALNDTRADLETNLTLLRRQEWIDIPIVYKSGRRALITLEKGIPGDKVFDQALDAWQSRSSG